MSDTATSAPGSSAPLRDGPAASAAKPGAAKPGTASAAELSHRAKLTIFSFLLLSMFMATLDVQIVSTALPTIVGELGAFDRFAWVSSAYLLAQSAIMPVYGKLGDLFGRKYVIMAAVSLFTLGSLACGLAWSMDTLIAARVLQGLGGGGIMVSIFSINADLFAPRERAKYQSFTSLVLMASGAIGPSLGGALSQAFGWRAIFLINLPIAVIALTGLALLMPNWRPDRKPKIDFAGAITLAVAIASLVLWADSRQIFGSQTAPAAWALLAVLVIAITLWIRIERRVPEPIIPLSLFAKRDFSLLLIITLLSGGVGIGLVNYHALFLQMTTGLSPSKAGLFFIAITGGIAIGSVSTGRMIARSGVYRPFLLAGLTLSTLVLLTLSQLPLGAPLWLLALLMLGQGLGIGMGQQAPVLGVQVSAPRRDIGAATGSVTLGRMGGASLAISAYGAILAWSLAQAALPGGPDLSSVSPEAMASLPSGQAHLVAAAFRHAFDHIYLMSAAMTALGILATLALPQVTLGQAEKPRG